MAPTRISDLGGLSPLDAQGPKPMLPLSPLSLSTSGYSSSKDDRHETELQEIWDKCIAKHMDLPDKYHHVHVLMIKWDDEIDQLEVRQEVNDLTDVFENVFNYEVTELNLGASKPQLKLNAEISRWLHEHDSRDNLLIVYYAGHGIYNQATKKLVFSPTNIDTHPRVEWNEAERPFLADYIEADVFTIMDCCYASDLLRNGPEIGRTFEMLAASHIGQTTSQPGDDSFTRSLINHLRQLADSSSDECFTTRDIEERMQKERLEEGPKLWRRIPGSSRHIRLSKLKPIQDRPKVDKDTLSRERFVHLGFALQNESFGVNHIELLTKKLPKVFKKAGAPLVDIKWLGCRKVGPHKRTFREVAQWVVENRSDLNAISPVSEKKRSAGEAGFEPGHSYDGRLHPPPKIVKVEA